ncbi:MAG: oligosaccharide flippase family protein [candidate division KSB1 bacterium]|nr:oligosaccharide flippase family protein [candidate division KSB1 bacterium]MDZ7335025.1 oligosaccharide flippase family protein [candidate division KSB1 bacterium]MDZ7357788.1 oligosaccharide flippase family protein [candidate division KSB1 bacterium]MDZ7399394.1 oligosaccharide flippase family protein [candidate division KSB1 bacterium]
MSLKLFGRNTLIYAFGTVFSHGAAFLLIPIYTHWLTMDEYGMLATLLISNQFMIILMNLGMRISLVRFTAEFEGSHKMAGLLGSSLMINVIGGILVTGLTTTWLMPLFQRALHCQNVFSLILLNCFGAFAQSLFIHVISLFRARNQAMKFMYANSAAAALMLLSTVIFLMVFHWGLKGVLIAQMIAYGIPFYVVVFDLVMKHDPWVSLRMMWRLLKFGVPLVAPQTAQSFMLAATLYLLSFYSDLQAVAIFSLGQKLAQIFSIILVTPFQLAFQPYVFANMDQPTIKQSMSKIFTYFILASAFLALVLLLGIYLIFPWIAPAQYAPAYLLIICLLPMHVVIGIAHFGESLLNIVKKTYITAAVILLCVAVSFVLNYRLIPSMSWYGAVLSLNISNLLIGIGLLSIGLGAFPLPLEWRKVFVALLSLALFLLSVSFVYEKNFLIFYTTNLVLASGVAMFLYWSHFFNQRELRFIFNTFAGKYWRRLVG